jgi:hypothetical protein
MLKPSLLWQLSTTQMVRSHPIWSKVGMGASMEPPAAAETNALLIRLAVAQSLK